MKPTTQSLVVGALRDRREAVAAGWVQAIEDTCDATREPADLSTRVDALSVQAIDHFLAEPFDPRLAEETGASLAELGGTEPEILGRVLEVFTHELLSGLPPEQAALLESRLSASAGWLAAGYRERANRAILDEQEAVHSALMDQLQRSQEAQREEVERALQESDRTTRALLRAPTELAALIDPEGTILDANEALALRVAKEMEELVGSCVWDLFPGEVGDRRRRHAETAIRSGRPVRFEDESAGAWHDSVFYPVLDEEGKVSRIVALARDITQGKQMEEALRESERTARALLSAPTYLAALADPEGVIVDCNDAFALRFGRSVDELVGVRMWDLLPPDLAERRKRYAAAAIESGQPVHFEDERLGMWFDNIAFPVLDEEGVVSRVAVLARDITEYKEVERALRQSESTARALLRAPTDAALLAETDGTILDLSETFALRFGRTVDELIGTCVWDLLPSGLREERQEHVESVLRSGKPDRFEDQRDGVWFDNVLYPVFDEEGGVSSVALLARDITGRKGTEEQLRRSVEELEHSRRLLLALSQASHAVQSARTPEDVYQTVGDQAKGLGYDAMIFSLAPDRQQMAIPYMTFEAEPLRLAEKVTGVSARNYRFALEPGGFFERTVVQATTVYTEEIASAMAETVPEPLKPRVGRVAAVLGIEQAILAPLTVEGETFGLLAVVGRGLREADTTAVEAFANGTAIALTNARLYEEVWDSAAGLERRVADRTEALESEVAERRRIEAGLRRAQACAIRSNRFLLALSQAAEAVQRAANPDEVYRAIGDQVEGAGYHAMVFALLEDQRHLALTHATWQPALMEAAEALLGISRWEARIPLAPDGFFQPVVFQGQSAFCEQTVDLATQGLPTMGRAVFGRLFGLLGMKQSIFAPLVSGGETWGVLCIAGIDLTADDVHAVSVFANQASVALEKARLLVELSTSRERLRRLTQQVVDAQEEERRRLSRALHDEAGQSLTALGISLDLIADDLPAESEPLRQRVGDAADLAVTTMERLRGLAQDLRPPALDAVGLSPTLKDACRMFTRRTRLSIDYQGMEGPALEEEVNICLYRFLQEALTNVARHAEAGDVRVALAYDAETVSLSVEDDGRGFDVESAPSDPEAPVGIGLLGMRERLESLGGWLEIASQPGAGARVVAHVPLDEAGP